MTLYVHTSCLSLRHWSCVSRLSGYNYLQADSCASSEQGQRYIGSYTIGHRPERASACSSMLLALRAHISDGLIAAYKNLPVVSTHKAVVCRAMVLLQDQ